MCVCVVSGQKREKQGLEPGVLGISVLLCFLLVTMNAIPVGTRKSYA